MKAVNLITGIMIVGLFIVAMISFGINFQSENNANVNINQDSRVGKLYSNINKTFNDISEQAGSSQQALNQEDKSITGYISDIAFSSIRAVGSTIMSGSQKMFGFILYPILSMLGLQNEIIAVISTVLTAIFIIIVSLLIWKLFKQGD